MSTTEAQTRSWRRNRVLHGVVFLLAMGTIGLNSETARAASLFPTDYRIAIAGDKFDGTELVAVAFKLRPPRRMRARHLELVVGALTSSAENRAFVSFGPVWRLPLGRSSAFLDLGISPTLLDGSSVNGRDLGGKFHFTSSIALGMAVSNSLSMALRLQHTSNGGLSSTNPGLDMIGLNIAYDFGQ